MVEVTVTGLSIGSKKISLRGNRVKDLLSSLGMADDAVIVLDKGGNILTRDKTLLDGQNLTIIEVFSGG